MFGATGTSTAAPVGLSIGPGHGFGAGHGFDAGHGFGAGRGFGAGFGMAGAYGMPGAGMGGMGDGREPMALYTIAAGESPRLVWCASVGEREPQARARGLVLFLRASGAHSRRMPATARKRDDLFSAMIYLSIMSVTPNLSIKHTTIELYQ